MVDPTWSPDAEHSSGIPAEVQRSLDACARGEIAPNVVLARIMMSYQRPADVMQIRDQLMTACAQEPDFRREAVLRVLALWRDHPECHRIVRGVLESTELYDSLAALDAATDHWRRVFDRAARVSPEASVAIYSLGDSQILQLATREVVRWMRDRGLVRKDRRMLEIGCGTGRFVAALAPELRSVTGIDLSRQMIAQAKKACAHLDNVELAQSAGRDLSAFRDACFDLVLAADSFPYLVEPEFVVAETHVVESSRVLLPGGNLLILNFSYRGDREQDRRDLTRLANQAGLEMILDGAYSFRMWDAVAYQFRKPA